MSSRHIGICGCLHRIASLLFSLSLVRFLVHGADFDEGTSKQQGDIQIDFGLDSHFLQDQIQLTPEAEERVRANVQKLVDFINKVAATFRRECAIALVGIRRKLRAKADWALAKGSIRKRARNFRRDLLPSLSSVPLFQTASVLLLRSTAFYA